MSSHPIKEVISEVLLGLQVHYPPWALELNLVKGPFQPHGKGGKLFITTLAHLIIILAEDIKQGHHAKDDQQFVQYMVNASGGPHIPSHICCSPLQ